MPKRSVAPRLPLTRDPPHGQHQDDAPAIDRATRRWPATPSFHRPTRPQNQIRVQQLQQLDGPQRILRREARVIHRACGVRRGVERRQQLRRTGWPTPPLRRSPSVAQSAPPRRRADSHQMRGIGHADQTREPHGLGMAQQQLRSSSNRSAPHREDRGGRPLAQPRRRAPTVATARAPARRRCSGAHRGSA